MIVMIKYLHDLVVIDTLPGRWRVVCCITATFLGGGIRDIPVRSTNKKYSTKNLGTCEILMELFLHIHSYICDSYTTQEKKKKFG